MADGRKQPGADLVHRYFVQASTACFLVYKNLLAGVQQCCLMDSASSCWPAD